MFQGFIGHHRAQIGATDPDIHHVPNALPREAFPVSGAHAVGKGRHAVKHRVNFGNHIHAIDNNLFALGRAERHVQHRPVFGYVNSLA